MSWSRLGLTADLVGAQFPRLKAKAAETTRLGGPALLSIWRDRIVRKVEVQVRVEEALVHCVEMDEIISANKHLRRLPEATAARLRDHCFGALG